MYIDAIEKLASADIRNIDADSLIDGSLLKTLFRL